MYTMEVIQGNEGSGEREQTIVIPIVMRMFCVAFKNNESIAI